MNHNSKVLSKVKKIECQYEEKPKKRFFQKCDDSLYANIPSPLRDNTHEAKRKFGAGDEYGEFGS